MTIEGRRERGKAEKRERIVAAVSNLLDAHGYEAMTTSQVAQQADVAAGTVFRYAASKPELLLMVAADRWEGTLVDHAPQGAGPVERILSVVAPLAEAARRRPDTALAVARELLFGTPGPHRDRAQAVVREIQAVVAQVLRDAGATDAGRVEAASRLVLSTALLELHGYCTPEGPTPETDARVRALLEVAVAGALAPTAR